MSAPSIAFKLVSARPEIPDRRLPGINILPWLMSVVGLGGFARRRFDRFFDEQIRPDYYKKMVFDGPAGDPGWYGPDSAMWHVMSHLPTVSLGLVAAGQMETLHPSIAWMAPEHSRIYQKEKDGTPTTDRAVGGARIRFAHSLVFFSGTAYGPTDTATRAARVVRAMHHTVKGVRPDGVAYDADDPRWLTWNYATVVWGLAAAHERYHPNPLRGAEIDRFYGEFVRVGEALGGVDLPATKREVLELLGSHLPELALSPLAASSFSWSTIRWGVPRTIRPGYWLYVWAATDLQPSWAQDLYGFDRPGRLATHALRHLTHGLLNGFAAIVGPLREYQDSVRRVGAVPSEQLRTVGPEDHLPEVDAELAREEIELMA